MPLFTAVLEFDGGTFITQVKATSAKNAVARYVTELLQNTSIGKASTRRRLAESFREEEPVLLETVSNVWCCCASVGSKFALLNLIRTAE